MRSVGINTYWGGDAQFADTESLAAAVSLRCIGGYMNQSLGLGASSGGSAKYRNNNTMNVFAQLTYLNNDELTGYEPIKRGDILRVSEQTSLRFIPFCNDSFYWDYPETL